MKIAFIVGKFPSLSETFILNQLTGLIDAGYEVDIFALNRPPDDTLQPEVEAYRLLDRTTYIDIPANKLARVLKMLRLFAANFPKHAREMIGSLNIFKHGRQALSLRLFYTLLPFLNSGPYDILHCHFGTVGQYGAMLKRLGVPGKLVVAFHGQDISRYTSVMGDHIYNDVFQQADLLMPVSNYWKEKLILLGANPNRTYVHRMGIDVQRFPFEPRSVDPAHEEVRLLTVGRLVEKKGIAYGIRAVAEVCRKNPEWNIRYEIIGEGEEREDLEQVIRDCGVENQVRLLGPATIDTVRDRIIHSHLFLLPSHTDSTGDQEGIPVSIMEAQATGMPVLSTQHTGVPELVEDGQTGYLVQERDAEALAARLEFLIRHPEKWAEMGRRGRDRIKERYDIKDLNSKLADTYRKLLAEPSKSGKKSLFKGHDKRLNKSTEKLRN